MTPEQAEELQKAVGEVQKRALQYQGEMAKHNAVLELWDMQKEPEIRMKLHEALDMLLDSNAECARLLRILRNEA